MSISKELKQQVRALSGAEREDLIAWLLDECDSPEQETDDSVDEEWNRVAARRLLDLGTGAARMVPSAEVHRRLKEKHGLAD